MIPSNLEEFERGKEEREEGKSEVEIESRKSKGCNFREKSKTRGANRRRSIDGCVCSSSVCGVCRLVGEKEGGKEKGREKLTL